MDDAFNAVVAGCQRKLARLYRTKAHLALAKARKARDRGDALETCRQVRNMRYWRRFAREWAVKAQGGAT